MPPSKLIHRALPIFLIGLVVVVTAFSAESMAVLMGPIELSQHRHIAASNLVTALLAAAALSIRAGGIMWRGQLIRGHVRTHRLGEICLLAGLILHRPFYVPYRAALEYDQIAWAMDYAANFGWLTSIGQSLWWIGCVLICVPQLASWAPRTWPFLVVALISSAWVIGYQAVDPLAAMMGLGGGR